MPTIRAYSVEDVLKRREEDKEKPKLELLNMINRLLAKAKTTNPIQIQIYNIYLNKENPAFLEEVLHEYRRMGWGDIQVSHQDQNTSLFTFNLLNSKQIEKEINYLKTSIQCISEWLVQSEEEPFVVVDTMKKKRQEMKKQIKALFVPPFEVDDIVKCNVENELFSVGLEGCVTDIGIIISDSGDIECVLSLDWDDGTF